MSTVCQAANAPPDINHRLRAENNKAREIPRAFAMAEILRLAENE